MPAYRAPQTMRCRERLGVTSEVTNTGLTKPAVVAGISATETCAVAASGAATQLLGMHASMGVPVSLTTLLILQPTVGDRV